jgi:hypothetical protein
MLVDSSIIYGESWYSLTPTKDELWIKRCGYNLHRRFPVSSEDSEIDFAQHLSKPICGGLIALTPQKWLAVFNGF